MTALFISSGDYLRLVLIIIFSEDYKVDNKFLWTALKNLRLDINTSLKETVFIKASEFVLNLKACMYRKYYTK